MNIEQTKIKIHKLPIHFKMYNKSITLVVEIREYEDKETFLEDLTKDGYSNEFASQILESCNRRIFEINWDLFVETIDSLPDDGERIKLGLATFRVLKEIYEKEKESFFNLQEGDVIITNPYNKYAEDKEKEAKSREYFSVRFNLSRIKKDGWCYGILDKNKEIRPL
jgi:hypothetical protein